MDTYILNEEKMFSDIADGVAIVINSETGIYYGMNAFGTNIFQNIISGCSISSLLDSLCHIKGISQNYEEELNEFINKLIEFEIIVPGTGQGIVDLDERAAQEDQFTMIVKEFQDAQELLLADPIHDVKNETGWQPDKQSLEDDEQKLKAKNDKIGL